MVNTADYDDDNDDDICFLSFVIFLSNSYDGDDFTGRCFLNKMVKIPLMVVISFEGPHFTSQF